MNKIRDFQRKRVYDWENSQPWMSKISYLTEQKARQTIGRLDKVFKRNTKIKFKNGYGCSFAVGKSEIHLRKRWGMNYGVILHEYAHLLAKDLHGRQFVCAYSNLLNIFHPKQPSIDELCETMYQFRVSHDCFDEWRRKHRLTKRHEPFETVPETAIVEKPKKKRVSAKQRVMKLLEEYPFLYVEGPTETDTPTPWVYGQFDPEDPKDPWCDFHYCEGSSWLEIEGRCLDYIELWNAGVKGNYQEG